MCGFIGIFGKKLDNKSNLLLNKSLELIKHRGPDDKHIFRDQMFKVNFCRLSIQDLTLRGRQPITSQTRKFVIVFNGEIYNFKKLKEQLKLKGVKFHSNCDTEVILKLYEIKKEKMIYDIEGMFSIVIYDKEKKKIFLARDRYGIKPLYYIYHDNILFFSSEVKAFLPLVKKFNLPWAINKKLLHEYFLYRNNIGPNTLFNSVKTLKQGNYLNLNLQGKIKLFEYYKKKINSYNNKSVNSLIKKNYSNFVEKLDNILFESVKKQMISDVPIGLSLSGGVDSSLLLAYMSRISKKKINTYSVKFSNYQKKIIPRELKKFDETKYAIEASKLYNSNHKIIEFDERDNLKFLENCIWQNDLPLSYVHSPAIYKLAKIASKKVKVLLGGEGADEVFAGYNVYTDIKKPINKLDVYSETSSTESFFNLEFIKNKNRENLKKIINKNNINSILLYYLDSKLISLQHRLDKMSMAASIEFRVPYLDENVVSFSKTLPPNLKSNFFTNKFILKKVAERYYSKEFVYRKKIGFSMPINYWMKKDNFIKKYISILSEERTLIRKIYKRESINKLLNDYKTKKDTFLNSNSGKIWSLINIELWIRQFFENKKYT